MLDRAPPGARLVFSCGWHISRDGQDVYPRRLEWKVAGPRIQDLAHLQLGRKCDRLELSTESGGLNEISDQVRRLHHRR